MDREEERESVIARLIANTRRKKRPNNLIEISKDIRWLENDLGSLIEVSRTIGISTDMLRKFLSVERLCPAVKKLVKERKIDLINIVHYMRNFNTEAQQAIAREVIKGKLSGNDVRVLAPLHTNLPQLTITQLIHRVQESRNIKVYIAYFRIPSESKHIDSLKMRFERIVGKNEIISFTVQNSVGALKLSQLGKEKLRKAAKNSNLSLRKFVDIIVKKED